MSDNRNDTLTSFLFGAAVGAGIALLISPETGSELRRKLGDGANRLADGLGDRLQNTKEDLKQRVGDVKSAIGAGRDAYARARSGEEPVPTSNAF